MDIPTFEEFLNEAPIAGYGDWVPNKERVFTKSLRQLRNEWSFADKIYISDTLFDIYKMNDEDYYILGTEEGEDFVVLFQIELRRRPDLENLFKYKYKNIMNVDGVFVKKSARGNKLAKNMYRYMVKTLNFTILSDEIQYHKARLTWSSLSKMEDLVVDIVNIDTGDILEEDAALYHGDADWEFDEKVWDYTTSKKDIRMFLVDIKD